MSRSVRVELSGVQLQLWQRRGVYWPNRDVLFVADPHFGKDATFRSHAIPVPRGTTEATLRSIELLLAETTASRLVILGDMFHDRSSLAEDVLEALDGFFSRHTNLQVQLVRGNHDRRTGSLPSSWPVELVEPGVCIDQVGLGHSPSDHAPGMRLLLCGHVHPAIWLGSTNDHLRLPCFWWTRQRLILPAIGRFTGTARVRMLAGDRAWVVTDEEIVERAR